MLRLVAFVGEDDTDLVPFFLEHYRKLGVDEFHIFPHGDWGERDLEHLQAADVTIVEAPPKPYTDRLRSSTLEPYARQFLGEWLILVDADEFLELPFSSLRRTIDALCCLGADELPAALLQRTSADGGLPTLADTSLDTMFPCYDYLLAERMIGAAPIWKSKYPLTKVADSFVYPRGNHLPHTGKASAQFAIRGVLHHFKWRDRLLRSIARIRGRQSNQHEQDGYLCWLEGHDFRVPTHGLRRYDRKALSEAGLLVRPTRTQLRLAAGLRKLRAGRDRSEPTSPRGSRSVLETPSVWRQGDDRAAAYLDRRSLRQEPGRIALVTNDLAGSNRAAGIGTAMAATAERLAAAGHDVHVFFCPTGRRLLKPDQIDYWKPRGVEVHLISRYPTETTSLQPHELPLTISRDLGQSEWDVIHFHDFGGYAAAALLERAAGLRHTHSRIIVAMHAPTLWSRTGNHAAWSRDEALRGELEAISVRLADLVICPSRYISEWCRRHYPTVAPHVLMPNSLTGETRRFSNPSYAPKHINEIVYFGRVEVRKGFEKFQAAIEGVLDAGIPGFRVTILGSIGTMYSLDRIADRTADWPCPVQVISNYRNLDAIDYLKTNDCIAVIPSEIDNLPYTVYECIENGIPFIASEHGGIPELIHEQDRSRVLVKGSVREYTSKLLTALSEGAAPARPAIDPDVADLDLLSLHARLVEEARSSRRQPIRQSRGKATVIIYGDSDVRPAVLESVIAEWRKDGRQVLLPSDASIASPATEGSVPDSAAASVGESCNLLAALASEELLLFCHESVTPALGALEALLSAILNTGADAAVCGVRIVDEAGVPYDVPAYAGPPELSVDSDVYGAPFFLIRKRALFSAGGFDADPGLSPIVHWELLNRMRATGHQIIGVPAALVMLRRPSPPIVLTEYQVARLATPWVDKAPVNAQGFVRMALLGPRKAESSAREAAAPEDLPLETEKSVEDAPGSFTFVVESAEDASECNFLVADSMLRAGQSRLLLGLFGRRDGADSTEGHTDEHGTLLRCQADAEVELTLSGLMQRAAERAKAFFGARGALHADPPQLLSIPNDSGRVWQGAVEYLTDLRKPDFLCELLLSSDCGGGELYFPSLDIAVRPSVGRLVVWPNSILHRHTVAPLKRGNRVSLQFGLRLGVLKAAIAIAPKSIPARTS